MKPVLQGVRVLDLTHVLADPFVAQPCAGHIASQSVGAQNQELLSALGYPPADIEAMRAQGVIA